jgi:hypothetical protein
LLYGKAVPDFAKAQNNASKAADASHVTLTPSDANKLMKFKILLPNNQEAIRNVHRMYLVAKAVFPPGTTVKPPNGQYNSALFGEFRSRKKDGKEISISSFKKKAMEEKKLPDSLHGAEYMCLAWHVKGMCNSNCGQREDHKPYSASQYAELVAWCEEKYPAGE